MAAREYSDRIRLHERYQEEFVRSRKITRWSELQWGTSIHSKAADLVDRSIGYNNKTLDAFIQEIPPGGKNSEHRHNCEAVVYIVSGEGYSRIGEEKVQWKAGDTIFIPPMLWHQHFNTQRDKPALYLAVTNQPQLMNQGLYIMEEREMRPTGVRTSA